MNFTDAVELQRIVQTHCRRTRQLSTAVSQLCWDLLLVLRGGRPALMLDYAFVPAAPLLALLRDLQQATGVQCALLSWGKSCHLVCNLSVLCAQLQAAVAAGCRGGGATAEEGVDALVGGHDACPMMVGFALSQGAESCGLGESSGLKPYWLPAHEAYPVLAALAPLRDALLPYMVAPMQPSGTASAAIGPAVAAAPAAAPVACVDLERLRGLPLMPTLNGWLLGYPALYLLRSVDEAQAAARALSCHELTLFRAAAGLLRTDSRGSHAGMLGERGAILSGFTVPTCLLAGAESGSGGWSSFDWRVDVWTGRMRAALAGDGWAAEVACEREDRGLQAVSL